MGIAELLKRLNFIKCLSEKIKKNEEEIKELKEKQKRLDGVIRRMERAKKDNQVIRKYGRNK